jgi:hypothetical protein
MMWLFHWIWAAITIPVAIVDFEVMCKPLDLWLLVFLSAWSLAHAGSAFNHWRTFLMFLRSDSEPSTIADLRGALVVVSIGVMQIVSVGSVTLLALSAATTMCPARISGTPYIIAAIAAWSLCMGWWHVRWIGRYMDNTSS